MSVSRLKTGKVCQYKWLKVIFEEFHEYLTTVDGGKKHVITDNQCTCHIFKIIDVLKAVDSDRDEIELITDRHLLSIRFVIF